MIPLYKPYMTSVPEINNILFSGQLAAGKYTLDFEKRIKNSLNLSNVFSISSYESALFILIELLNLKEGDEIICSPMSCLASTQPYAIKGMKIVWADINPRRGTLCPDSVKMKITNNTKLIVHNHFCGYPGYIDEINEIGKEFGIPILDDCIEGFGSKYRDYYLGEKSKDFAVYSFATVRFPNTIEGAALEVKDEKNNHRLCLLRDLGVDRANFRDEFGEIKKECDISNVGYAAKLNNVNAYIGCCQLDKFKEVLEIQRKNALEWGKRLEEWSEIVQMEFENSLPNYWVMGLLVPDKLKYMKKFRQSGMYASGVHLNNNLYSIFGNQIELPGVNDFYNHFLAVPCGWWVSKESIKELDLK